MHLLMGLPLLRHNVGAVGVMTVGVEMQIDALVAVVDQNGQSRNLTKKSSVFAGLPV